MDVVAGWDSQRENTSRAGTDGKGPRVHLPSAQREINRDPHELGARSAEFVCPGLGLEWRSRAPPRVLVETLVEETGDEKG